MPIGNGNGLEMLYASCFPNSNFIGASLDLYRMKCVFPI